VFCNRCGVEVADDEPTCAACGAVLDTPDEAVVVITVSDEPQLPAPRSTSAPPRSSAPYDLAVDEPDLLDSTPTTPTPAATPRSTTRLAPVTSTTELPVTGPRRHEGVRFGVVPAMGTLTFLVAVAGLVTPLVAVATDARTPTFPVGEWRVDDLGTNLPGSLMVALVALAVGVIGAAFGQRWAAGLAGGAGLAVAGWAALTAGLAERPLALAVEVTRRPTTEAFNVTITRDVGIWLVLVAGVFGVLTFVVSLTRAGNDRRRGLNPWIAALGAVASLVAAAGPLLPEGTADVVDNWDTATSGEPLAFLVGRLVQLGLLAYSGVVGFLLVRRYGLGLAVGGMTAVTWLALTVLLDLGTDPVGPAFTNPGSDQAAIDLHSVTIVGMIALVGLAMVAVIAAYDQAAREYQP
jgi:hypothetical protein